MTDPPSDPIGPVLRRTIETRLSAIEAAEEVRLVLAVESGSRAWGFPSPDSDYDVRFLYVRPVDRYLSMRPVRDVIEAPIADAIDLVGWDVRKALGLLLKSNAAVVEWMASPIRYRVAHPTMTAFAAFADDAIDPRGLARHYASLGRNAAGRWLRGEGDVPVKRYFYALRPALAIRCLRRDPGSLPPMDLQGLIAKSGIAASLVEGIERLVEAKRGTDERGTAIRLPEIEAFIAGELDRAEEAPSRAPPVDLADRADALFLGLVKS